jgi:hypothetical protein
MVLRLQVNQELCNGVPSGPPGVGPARSCRVRERCRRGPLSPASCASLSVGGGQRAQAVRAARFAWGSARAPRSAADRSPSLATARTQQDCSGSAATPKGSGHKAIKIDFERQIVLRANRLILVRSVKCVLSLSCKWWCARAADPLPLRADARAVRAHQDEATSCGWPAAGDRRERSERRERTPASAARPAGLAIDQPLRGCGRACGSRIEQSSPQALNP